MCCLYQSEKGHKNRLNQNIPGAKRFNEDIGIYMNVLKAREKGQNLIQSSYCLKSKKQATQASSSA